MGDKNYFTLYNKILDFNNYVRNYIAVNIPSVSRDIRIHLLDECYNLSKNMFYATYNKGNIRMKYLIEIKVNLSLIDMLITNISSIQCIQSKNIKVAINKLSDIKNIIYGWIINEENKKK